MRHGVGMTLSRRADAAAIADAIMTMLREPSYRAAAADLGMKIRAEADSGTLMAELEGLARSSNAHT